MNKYRCFFVGRQAGAQGLFGRFVVTVLANSVEEANLKLYDTHEHISMPRFQVRVGEEWKEVKL